MYTNNTLPTGLGKYRTNIDIHHTINEQMAYLVLANLCL